ncbi:MAG TPA: alpha/beta fold hydrolase [Solirubrobacteraceae bacterium]|nr:alpha/beta fold hydrolase [Solirubrobacteraceae bacterium]
MRHRPVLVLLVCLVTVGAFGVAAVPPVLAHRASRPVGAAVRSGQTVRIDGYRITTRCTGPRTGMRPAIVLLAGEPDPLTKFSYIQRRLSSLTRVCSYDRLGEGTSSKPRTVQTLSDSARILHLLIARLHIASHGVVLVGHSLGGLIAARYASQYRRTHQVKAVVLLDATPPSIVKAIERLIRAGATGIAGEVRAEIVGLATGHNPERLVFTGAPLPSIGNLPLTVVQHGKPIFAAVPKYGRGIQRIWAAGQRQWLRLAPRSRMVIARHSGHYIYLDQPGLTLRLIREALGRGR